MARTKRDTRPLTLITVIPPDAPRTEADLTPEQAETAYRTLGRVMAILANVRLPEDDEPKRSAA